MCSPHTINFYSIYQGSSFAVFLIFVRPLKGCAQCRLRRNADSFMVNKSRMFQFAQHALRLPGFRLESPSDHHERRVEEHKLTTCYTNASRGQRRR